MARRQGSQSARSAEQRAEHFAEALDEFSNDLFNSFFDDPPLLDRDSLLDMEVESPAPPIQAEHSYSLSEDSAPQSPALTIKEEDEDSPSEPASAVWALEHELCSLLVKQEQHLISQVEPVHPSVSLEQVPVTGVLQSEENISRNSISHIKVEPGMPNHLLNVTPDVLGVMPLTPPSSHSSDSDGSQSPRSLPPPSPARPAARSSHAISSSPLLTAPHKLQGTSGPLMLTEEERRTLVAEGYPIPTKLPLTKTEEKALKRVRRKIKNKISAQESRRKKKEYVECLEKKVESFTSQNSELWKKVETLENANRSLLQQLQKLQTLVTGKVPRPCKLAATQTGTCLMVVVLCFILAFGSMIPSFPEFSSGSQTVKSAPLLAPDLYTLSQIRSRNLLSYDEGAGVSAEDPTAGLGDHRKWSSDAASLGDHLENAAHERDKYLGQTNRKNQTHGGFTRQEEGGRGSEFF